MTKPFAYSQSIAFESASDLPYNRDTGEYVLSPDILAHYARIIAYKVAHNLENGFTMEPGQDPLTYIDCGVEE